MCSKQVEKQTAPVDLSNDQVVEAIVAAIFIAGDLSNPIDSDHKQFVNRFGVDNTAAIVAAKRLIDTVKTNKSIPDAI